MLFDGGGCWEGAGVGSDEFDAFATLQPILDNYCIYVEYLDI